MTSPIETAYRAVCDNFSADRVIADPVLNERFIAACREAGLEHSVRDLNLALINLRKSGGLGKSTHARPTRFKDQDAYRHASEIAARHLEVKHGVSWDEIVATPDLVAEFDAEAASIAPGFDSLRYRWAVFTLRKSRKLAPELMSRVVAPTSVTITRVEEIRIPGLPRDQGIYLFYWTSGTLYVGEAENLRQRISKHVDHSDNKGLARWFWEHGITGAHLELRTLPPGTPTRVRRALEVELIRSRQPLFNIKLS